MPSTLNSLRAAAGLAALAALAIGVITGCSSSGSSEVIVSSESPDSVESPTPEAATPEGVAQPPEPTAVPAITPTESPDASGLVWTEVDLADALGASENSTISLESVGDGRVLAQSFSDRGIAEILVTEDSTEWSPIPVPDSFLPWSVDIAGERWLIQGWDSTIEAPFAQILFSDDEGASWTEVVVDLDSLDGTAWIADAIVGGERIVVVALSDTEPADNEEAFDDEMDFEPSQSNVHVFLSDGGPAEFVIQFPGWFTGGYGASDGFHLITSDSAGEDFLLHSPDGREWSRTIVDVEVTDSAQNELWTNDQTDGKFRVERFEGVYGSDQVLTLPDGVSWVVDLAVGPAGVAAVGGEELPYSETDDEFPLPDMRVEKDGYELRYNEPEGGITLWDLAEESAVYVFDAETVQNETPPEGVREVENDEGFVMVVFEDPETGAELVTFSDEELSAAFMDAESAAINSYDPYNFFVGWSPDGTDWEWQTLQEAFGLPERSQDDNSFTEVQVAVGHDFVIAQVQTYEFPEVDFGESAEIGVGDGQSGSVSAPLTAVDDFPYPPRWFIARVG